jgi:hypothetical protein
VGLPYLWHARQEIPRESSWRRSSPVMLIGQLGGFAHPAWEQQVRGPARGRARTARSRSPGQRSGLACSASICLSRHLRNLRLY